MAAAPMRFATTSGWDDVATGLDAMSEVAAPVRCAKDRLACPGDMTAARLRNKATG